MKEIFRVQVKDCEVRTRMMNNLVTITIIQPRSQGFNRFFDYKEAEKPWDRGLQLFHALTPS